MQGVLVVEEDLLLELKYVLTARSRTRIQVAIVKFVGYRCSSR